MDEDIKTLLAILALVYGSSNGLGLLKTALEPVEKSAEALADAMKVPTAAPTFLAKREKNLSWALWSPRVLVYVVLVIIVPLFLALVVWRGPIEALARIGLNSRADNASTPKTSIFYWILLVLSLLASVQYLSSYLKGWRLLVQSWNRRRGKK